MEYGLKYDVLPLPLSTPLELHLHLRTDSKLTRSHPISHLINNIKKQNELFRALSTSL